MEIGFSGDKQMVRYYDEVKDYKKWREKDGYYFKDKRSYKEI